MFKKKSSVFLYAICLIILFIAASQKLYAILCFGFPKELREYTSIKMAVDFANGVNPYALSLLEGDLPFSTNMYGFLAPLFFSPFVKLFSFFSALQVCECIAFIIELIGILFFYKAIYLKTSRHTMAIFGSVLAYACFWRYTPFGGAYPDQFGITLCFFLIYLLTLHEKKQRYRPFAYILITVLLFYIKQYFVLTAFGVFIYLWVNDSKKSAFQYVGIGILCGLLSMCLVNTIFPLYFTETLALAHGQTSSGNVWYSLSQPIKLVMYYIIPFSAIIIGFILAMIQKHKTREISIHGFLSLDFGHYKISYELIQLFCMFPLVFYIAQNKGTYYTYYLQLWLPYLIFTGVVMLNYLLNCLTENTYYLSIGKRILIAASFTISLLLNSPWILSTSISVNTEQNWNEAYDILSEYSANDGQLLVSAHLAGYCIENDKYTSEYGQAEFNNQSNYDNWTNSLLWKTLFPQAGELLHKNIDYNNRLTEAIRNGEFSCIALTNSTNYGLPYDAIDTMLEDSPYILLTTLDLCTGDYIWPTYFYILAD